MTTPNAPALIVGGSGTVGSHAVRTLRRLQPDLPITIGARDVARADALAAEVGGADVAKVDLERPDLGLTDDRRFSAIATLLKDETLHTLRYAQSRHLPYLSVASAAFEIGPEVAFHVHAPAAAPILMASNWLAGAATLSALRLARTFAAVDRIEIAALLDELDVGGPAAHADYERQTTAGPKALVVSEGRWRWEDPTAAGREVRGVDGVPFRGEAFGSLDVLSLAPATGARSVRFVYAVGESATRRAGAGFSTEIVVEITGTRPDGDTGTERLEIVHPAGQAPVTATGVAVGIERLLGLAGGPPVTPGLHLPSTVIDPSYLVARLEESGTRFRRASPGPVSGASSAEAT